MPGDYFAAATHVNTAQRPTPPLVEIYTDGACRGNPGLGGWGAILRYGPTEKKISGATNDTTNNRMELVAAIEALSQLKVASRVRLWTDSRYVQQGVSAWLPKWKKNGWRTSNKTAVKNDDLWRQLDTLSALHDVDWRWVKGHDGNIGNEIADQLANAAIDDYLAQQGA